MKYRKIKYSNYKVELVSVTRKANGAETEIKYSTPDEPSPEFVKAYEAFKPKALELLELEGYGAGFKVIGLSINEEEGDGRCGIVVTCAKALKSTNAPLILNTPHLREPVGPDDRGAGFMPDGWMELIFAIQEQAQKYDDGERAQTNAFAGAGVG
jgi:hypothetical protein